MSARSRSTGSSARLTLRSSGSCSRQRCSVGCSGLRRPSASTSGLEGATHDVTTRHTQNPSLSVSCVDRRIPKEALVKEERDRVSMDEIEAEDAVSLPNKEVMSLLDVNANVDLGLDLAAPVDLAVAANLNVAAPIEASASANLLSPDAQAVSLAQQHGSIDQG